MQQKKIPPYYFFRILLVGALMYSLLILPYYGTIRMDQFAELVASNDISIDKNPDRLQVDLGFKKYNENLISKTLHWIFFSLSILLLLGVNIPVKIFFKKKRKGKQIPTKIKEIVKKHAQHLPAFNTMILFGPMLIISIIGIFEITSLTDYPTPFLIAEKKLYIIHILATLLTSFFLFYWQKNRLQFVYLEHIFSEEELKRVTQTKHKAKIATYFILVNSITILLPVAMVVFYLSMSITKISALGIEHFSEGQMQILFNSRLSLTKIISIDAIIKNGAYINADNTVFMIWGLAQSGISSLIYLIFFIKWSTRLVVKPIQHLLQNMQITGEGNMANFSIVRSNDEIGQLSVEYNKMSARLKTYFDEVTDLNKNLEQKVLDRTATINEQKEEIVSQRDSLLHKNSEIESQNEEIIQQRDILHQQKQEITDSIHYAQRIQNAVIPDNTVFSSEELMLFFKPRDIVSGDFYYIQELGDKRIIAAADCTGHGVPGAFMSMLGISFLNEILKKGTTNPAEILEELRRSVKSSLKQHGKETKQKDGMDMALCVFDKKEKYVEYAGAYNPLFLIRHGELSKYKAVRNPIGVYVKENPFVTNRIELKTNDMLYIFSDGFPDQFGGKHGSKYKSKKFKDLLTRLSDMPVTEQEQALKTEFEQWQGNFPQTDDVIVLGVRV
ncbi:MAG: SpoIIE family protein phosphatase [Bacteroidota bacterium]|nr:SpoIIE family protein phosphatase [Bacteroidota bacterium]